MLLILGLGSFACEEPAATEDQVVEAAFDEATETAAIMKVIEEETACFFARDYNCWKEQWINEEYAFMAWSNSDGTYEASVGWAAVDATVGKYIADNPEEEEGSSHPDVKRKGMQVKFFGPDVAHLMWEQYNSNRAGDKYRKSQEVRLMERVDGTWKIVNMSAFWNYEDAIPADSLMI